MTWHHKILYFVTGFFVAITILYTLSSSLLERNFPYINEGWSTILLTSFENVHQHATPLIKLVGFITLIGCFISFFKASQCKKENYYESILPLIACALLALSCLFLTWGYALVGMLGLCSYLFLAKTKQN